MLGLEIDGRAVGVKRFRFAGGETQVRIEDDAGPEAASGARLLAHLHDADAVMALLLLTDAVRRRHPGAAIDLVCPYLPYARQDRVMVPGEALSAAVMCRLLNAEDFRSVEVWDAHSDVSLALLDRVRHRHAAEFVAPLVGARDVLVAPDAGAVKRVAEVAARTGAPLVHAEKRRSPQDGRITGTIVHSEPIGDRDFLIVDDICDGGRTFTALAEALRPLTSGRVRLYVTHGIFSAGFAPFEGLIDEILVANSFRGELPGFVRRVEGVVR